MDGRQFRDASPRSIEEMILHAVGNDGMLAATTLRKVAEAAADGRISRSELATVLEKVAQGRRAGTIERPAAYFGRCAMQLFFAAGIPWSNPANAPSRRREA